MAAPAAVIGNEQLQRRAEAAYLLCAVDPARARDSALEVIAAAADDPTAAVLGMRALGRALRSLSGSTEAAGVLREAIRLAQQQGLTRALADVRVSYAGALADLGKIDAALAQCELAAATMRGRDAGPVLAQRGLILCRAGRSEEALAYFARALPVLRAARDVNFQCLLYMNRGNLFAYLGRLPAAERDFHAGAILAKAHGMREIADELAANLGFLAVRRGDIPYALRVFDGALAGAGTSSRFTLTQDRAEALLVAGRPRVVDRRRGASGVFGGRRGVASHARARGLARGRPSRRPSLRSQGLHGVSPTGAFAMGAAGPTTRGARALGSGRAYGRPCPIGPRSACDVVDGGLAGRGVALPAGGRTRRARPRPAPGGTRRSRPGCPSTPSRAGRSAGRRVVRRGFAAVGKRRCARRDHRAEGRPQGGRRTRRIARRHRPARARDRARYRTCRPRRTARDRDRQTSRRPRMD